MLFILCGVRVWERVQSGVYELYVNVTQKLTYEISTGGEFFFFEIK